jgi:hypothetical protein
MATQGRGIGRKRSESFGNPQAAISNIEGVKSLFSGFNKLSQTEGDDTSGIVGVAMPVLSLDVEDDVLLTQTRERRKAYQNYCTENDIKNRQEDNYDYWKGKQRGSIGIMSRGTDNLVFESEETLLPIICRQNPDPMVESDSTDEGEWFAEKTTDILARKADETRLKSKIRHAARNWNLNLIAAFKMGWDEKINDMFYQVVDSTKLILDPAGIYDGGEFTGKYIGEKRSDSAENLAKMFPEHKEHLYGLTSGNMGTVVEYTEWWTNDMLFWQLGNVILDKKSNPYWNEETESQTMDEFGATGTQSVAVNHFASPKMPYSFISVFNTGRYPHDDTSLIEQIKPLQDIVNKRLRQIDKNADETNNSWVFNKDFSQDQAKEALDSLRSGGAIIATTDKINDSVMRMQAPELADYVYQDMQDKREQIYNIMGVRGSTAQGIISEDTVRGKIQIKGQDVDRLSLIVEQIEQAIDHLYNLAVQTMYVYYTPEILTRALGPVDAQRYYQLLKTPPSRRLVVSVKEGSMIPRDELTKRNEAIDLFQMGALDPETLFERLKDFADPKQAALKFMQFKNGDPAYIQELGGQPPAPVMPTAPQQIPPQAPIVDPNQAPPQLSPLQF